MPTVAETEMNCPDCGVTIRATAIKCDCGWTARSAAFAKPDNARIAADRERMIAGAFDPYDGPRACQERTCHVSMRAVTGKDFCAKHQAMFERDPESVRKCGMPANIRAMLRHLET